MPAAELLAYLADELDAPPGEPGLAGSVRRVRRAWRDVGPRCGDGRLLVVDEAHLIDDPADLRGPPPPAELRHRRRRPT